MLDPSHQGVSRLAKVGGSSLGSDGRVGSGRVRMTCNGLAGHGSSGSSGTSQGLSCGLGPWLNQSRIMNCSHDAARALAAVAGLNSSRVIRARLTRRGLGSNISNAGSGKVSSIGTLRPNREPALPIAGWSRSLWVPSAVRNRRVSSVSGSTSGTPTAGWLPVSYRFFLRSTSRTPMRTRIPTGVGSRSQPTRWSRAWAARPNARQNNDR